MDDQRLTQDIVHRLARMQRGVGILEDELHQPPVLPAAAFGHGGGRPSISIALLLDGDQPGDGLQHRRFARARFADDAEGFAGGDVEGDAAHRMDRSAAVAERDAEILHRDHSSHSGSRVTVASSARRTSSEGAAAISARV